LNKKGRVLTGWPVEDKQTGAYIIKALQALHYQVVNVDPKAVHRYAMSNGLSVDDLITKILDDQYAKHKPDFVFLSRHSWFTSFAEKHRGEVPIAGWNVDVRYYPEEEWGGIHPLIKACSHWFTIAGGNVMWYRKNLNPNTHWLSEGIDPEFHRAPTTSEITKIKSTYTADMFSSCDVSFAGSPDPRHVGPPNRMDLLRSVHKRYKLKLWGNIPGNYLVNFDHSIMAALSPINLGHSGWPLVTLSQSARDYRVLGAGGFLLTNYVRGYEEWLVPGQHLDVYENIDDCISKIKWYLDNPTERLRISRAGAKEAHARHKFEDRIKAVLHIIGGGKDPSDDSYERWATDRQALPPAPDSNIVAMNPSGATV
jgi:hypothetical protein